MKMNLLAVGALAAALAMPLGASAQQDQQYPGPSQGQPGAPSHARLQHRWMRRLSHLNLSNDQQQRIQSMIDQYSQAHPEGSAVDPNANRQLRQQIMGVLSGDQQNQLQQEMRAHRAAMQQRQQQQQQGQQYQGPPQQDQGPPQQYQGPPQQYQGPPQQDQGPPQQYQGPPQQDQGPPPGQQPPDDQGPPPPPR